MEVSTTTLKMETTYNVATHRNYADTMWCTYILSVLAANNAELFTYPFDLCKTRLQIQGEIAASKHDNLEAPHRGMVRTAIGIVREEGFFKLWGGMLPAIYRQVINAGVRVVAYEYLRENVLKKNADGSFPAWKSAICGVASGSLSQFLATPADLIKVQMQVEGKRRLLGKPPRVLNAHHAFSKIWSEGGIPGLWKGAVPSVQRAALVTIGDLSAYDVAKQFVLANTSLQEGYITHFLASTCAGFVAAVLGTPADVVKTRVMNQHTDSKGKGLVYKSTLDCFLKTVKNEGFFALYKGFIPVWLRLGPWNLVFWMTFEKLRYAVGGSSF